MADRDIDKELQTIKKDLDKLRIDMTELVGTLRDRGRERVVSARDAIEEGLDGAFAGLKQGGARAVARVGSEVEERPLTTLLAAFGLGFVIGKLLDRR